MPCATASPVAQLVESAGVGDPDLIPDWGRSPGDGNGNLLQCFRLVKSHEERSLVGYSP